MQIIRIYVCVYYRSLILKLKVQPVVLQLDQMVDGLKLYGLLDEIRKYADLYIFVFCPNNNYNWTFAQFEEFTEPQYSERGSSDKLLEVDTFVALMDAMECIFYEGKCDYYYYYYYY